MGMPIEAEKLTSRASSNVKMLDAHTERRAPFPCGPSLDRPAIVPSFHLPVSRTNHEVGCGISFHENAGDSLTEIKNRAIRSASAG